MLSRRNILATAAVGALSATAVRAAGFGNPDQPPEGAVNVTNPKALVDPGPQDPSLAVAATKAAFQNPPATDVNGMPQFWSSFNLSPKRIQNGGWARQVGVDSFRDFQDDRRRSTWWLGPNGVREALHWHQQADMGRCDCPAICRITIPGASFGRPQVMVLMWRKASLWYFPRGPAPFLQGGPGTRWERVYSARLR